MNYNKNGYLLLDTELSKQITEIRLKLINVFSTISMLNGLGEIDRDDGVIELYKGKYRDLWVGAYDQLRYLPEISALAGNEVLLSAARQAGIMKPILASRLILRADMPGDDSYDFPLHQDLSYNHGSANSVTLWVPFQDVDSLIGSLIIVPGSHRDGALPHEQGICLKADLNQSYIEVPPMKVGSILCFSQLLLHKSGRNISTDKIRFSVQIRYNDLADADFAKRKYHIEKSESSKSLPQIEFDTHIF